MDLFELVVGYQYVISEVGGKRLKDILFLWGPEDKMVITPLIFD